MLKDLPKYDAIEYDLLEQDGFDDTIFFTVKQIDDFLESKKLSERHSQFAIDHVRNILIHRMQSRIRYYVTGVLNEGFGVAQVKQQLYVNRNIGFGHFRKMMQSMGSDVSLDEGDYEKGSCKVIEYLLYIWSRDVSINDVKFIFSTESVEARFHWGAADISIEYYYDTPSTMMVSAMRGNHMHIDEFTNPHKAYRFLYSGVEYIKSLDK